MPYPIVYYMGCYQSTGHYLFSPGYDKFGWREEKAIYQELGVEHLDGDRKIQPPPIKGYTAGNGIAKLTHHNGHTFLCFWDNSVDNRSGSHSTYATKGTLDFVQMCEAARTAYPEVWRRYRFPITAHPDNYESEKTHP